MKTASPFDAILPAELLIKAESVGVAKATKSHKQAFMLAITAGVFISIAFAFYTTVTTGTTDVAYGLKKFMGGFAFSLGLLLVVVCGGELFTSSILTIIARANNKITTAQLAKNWAVVYAGNFIGCIFFVMLMILAKQHLVADGAWGINAMKIAQHKLHHTFIQAVTLGILANLLVCLGVWMSFAARSITDKFVAVALPVSMFVASGYEHSIANMFMIPLGYVIANFSGPEFWLVTGANPADFTDLTLSNFVFNNLIPVTIGNIIGGGVLVGLTYWAIYCKKES
ncbi:MAG: formate transporter FocA [Moritella sp.]|uniref:formate transporter FocA n=1 Tax=Moritella sp. TaxID=78556 RepID=UPI00299FA8E7|nr:formate transporter FocA [Moritella sp.]MDX2320404.1 formate transporter FocA [Moritella sp.]